MEFDDEVCYCFHVSKRKILNYIRRERPRVVSQVSHCSGAGTGCGWCIPFLRKFFAQETGRAVEQDEAVDETMTAADYAQRRGAYIRAGKGTPPAGATPSPE